MNDSGTLAAGVRPARIEIEAVVIRSNGHREDLGAIAYWDRNLLRRARWRIHRALARLMSLARDVA
jgi:hypothetical protein